MTPAQKAQITAYAETHGYPSASAYLLSAGLRRRPDRVMTAQHRRTLAVSDLSRAVGVLLQQHHHPESEDLRIQLTVITAALLALIEEEQS